jgi:hypothetical protein
VENSLFNNSLKKNLFVVLFPNAHDQVMMKRKGKVSIKEQVDKHIKKKIMSKVKETMLQP